MGGSRDTFYCYQELVDDVAIDNLINRSGRTPNTENRVDEATEQAVVAYTIEQPTHSQHLPAMNCVKPVCLSQAAVFVQSGFVVV